MKTLEEFKSDMAIYTELSDFVIYTKEWNQFEYGTKAICVRMYDYAHNNVLVSYVLMGLENTSEVLKSMQQVPPSYSFYTDLVIRN